MRQEVINIYKFDELSEQAKETARQWYREGLDYPSFIIEEWPEQAKERGFDIDKIYYSGFWSQGDGAMFEGSVNDFTKFCEGLNPHFIKLVKSGNLDLTCHFTHSGHYYHERSVNIHFSTNNADIPGTYKPRVGMTGNIYNELDKLEEAIGEAYRDECRSIYKALEEEYEYQNSDECIDETILINEYEFDENGKRA